jgi:hypothetical protein
MAGTTWIQFDEPALVMGLKGHHLDAFSKAYSFLEDVPIGIKLLVETYFISIISKILNIELGKFFDFSMIFPAYTLAGNIPWIWTVTFTPANVML